MYICVYTYTYMYICIPTCIWQNQYRFWTDRLLFLAGIYIYIHIFIHIYIYIYTPIGRKKPGLKHKQVRASLWWRSTYFACTHATVSRLVLALLYTPQAFARRCQTSFKLICGAPPKIAPRLTALKRAHSGSIFFAINRNAYFWFFVPKSTRARIK